MIKTIVFDFDETIYIGYIGNPKKYDLYLVDTALGLGTYDKLSDKYGIRGRDIKDFVDASREEGLDYIKVVENFKRIIFRHKHTGDVKVLPNELFRKLREKYPIYIASMSQQNYLNNYFKVYGIDRENFVDVLSMDLVKDKSKGDMLKRIKERENCHPEEILMVGDSLTHDIIPAKELGMQTFHMVGDFNQLYDFFTENNILNCDEFKKK